MKEEDAQVKMITFDMIKPEFRANYTQELLDAGMVEASDLIDNDPDPVPEKFIALDIVVSEYHQKVLEASATDIGRYGLMRLSHLQEHKPDMYARMILDETLLEHCAEINRSIHDTINAQRKKWEYLKANQMEYVSRCRMLESDLLKELVYTS